jgi:hypothetical protein
MGGRILWYKVLPLSYVGPAFPGRGPNLVSLLSLVISLPPSVDCQPLEDKNFLRLTFLGHTRLCQDLLEIRNKELEVDITYVNKWLTE